MMDVVCGETDSLEDDRGLLLKELKLSLSVHVTIKAMLNS